MGVDQATKQKAVRSTAERKEYMKQPLRRPDEASHPGMPAVLTVTEACEVLRISRWSLYQLIRSRQLDSYTIGRRRFISETALWACLDRLQDEGAV